MSVFRAGRAASAISGVEVGISRSFPLQCPTEGVSAPE